MINVMHSLDQQPMNQAEKSLDPQLWQACAGGMAQIPPPNSKVYYFPQGHAEHANYKNIDFNKFPRIPPLVPCRVSSIKYLADAESDEVFAKIRLVPLGEHESCGVADDDCESVFLGLDGKEKTNSFAKTLTQSDANNGGGFSVPRYCAETIFPRLDYSAEPPVQTILVRDVHGQIWKFRHIYRGTPRRHLLTTGWSNFVNQKRLVAGDSIVFLRAENGDLCVGIRRAKRGVCGWNTGPTDPGSGVYGFSDFLSESGSGMAVGKESSERGECVLEAMSLAANREAFEVVYCPRASTPEFVVRQSAVRDAVRVKWCLGMRFKMAFETEDSSRISWFMGTISFVGVEDPVHWPNSPWRLLQVAWDEPDLLQNVKRVSPWLVELVSSMPADFYSPVSLPAKRPRHHNIPTLLTNPLSPSSPLCCLDSISSAAGVQGARHARSGPSDPRFKNLQMGLQPFDFKLLNHRSSDQGSAIDDDVLKTPLLLKIGSSGQEVVRDGDDVGRTPPLFFLFGQPILTADQISQSNYSLDTDNNSSSDGNQENTTNVSSNASGSVPSSDGEFSRLEVLNDHALCSDAKGTTKHVREGILSDFIKRPRGMNESYGLGEF